MGSTAAGPALKLQAVVDTLRFGENATERKNTAVARRTMAGPVGGSYWNDRRTPIDETSTPMITE